MKEEKIDKKNWWKGIKVKWEIKIILKNGYIANKEQMNENNN